MLRKILPFLLLLLFLVGCGEITEKPKLKEENKATKLNYKIVKKVSWPKEVELGYEKVDKTSLIVAIPTKSKIINLDFEEKCLKVYLSQQKNDNLILQGMLINFQDILPPIEEIKYYDLNKNELKINLSLEDSIICARQYLNAEINPTYMTLRLLEREDKLDFGYYLDFREGEVTSNKGDRVVSGWIGVSTADATILDKQINYTYLPGAKLVDKEEQAVRDNGQEGPKGFIYKCRKLVKEENKEAEFGPILTALKAVDSDGRENVIWQDISLAWDLGYYARIYKVSWSPDGNRTYFSIADPGPHYGDWYTHSTLWEYNWQTNQVNLITYMPKTDFILSETADRVFFNNQVIYFKDWKKNMVNVIPDQPIPLLPGPSSETMQPWYASINPAKKVMVFKTKGNWAYVQQEGVRGWIPAWYLQTSDKKIKKVEPVSRVIKKENTPVYLYPEDNAPKILELEKGRVVKVKKACGRWRFAEITVYDIPGVFWGWFKEDSLFDLQEVQPREGLVKKETTAYLNSNTRDIEKAETEIINHDMTVMISGEKGEYYEVWGAGGWSAWVKKTDVILDPWVNSSN